MNPDELYSYSLSEFMAKLEGARKMENMRSRETWEQTREIAFTVAQYSGNMKKGATKYHLMPFPWDDKKQGKSIIANLTGEDRKQAARDLLERQQQILKDFLEKRKN